MVANTNDDFSKRLNSALDQADYIKGRGRRVALAKALGVSGEAARKWLSGESIPAMDNAVRLAVLSGTDVDWLLTGRLSNPTPPPRPASAAPDLTALMAAASPRSRSALERIARAAEAGALSEADVLLLEQIAERFGRKG